MLYTVGATPLDRLKLIQIRGHYFQSLRRMIRVWLEDGPKIPEELQILAIEHFRQMRHTQAQAHWISDPHTNYFEETEVLTVGYIENILNSDGMINSSDSE